MEIINLNDVSDLEFEDIEPDDYPDFSNAFISSAYYKGEKMTDKMLDSLNEDSDFVYAELMNHLY